MKTINKSILILGLLTFVLQSCTHDVYVDPLAAEKSAYENADAVNGAKLFSNFQHVDAGWPWVTPADVVKDPSLANLVGWPNPKFAADPTINTKDIGTYTAQAGVTTPVPAPQANRNFYSCAGCHAIDGMGRSEAGVSKKTAKAQPDFAASHLRDTRGWDIVKLFDAIKNVGGRQIDPTKTADGLNLALGGQTHPDFSKILTDDKIWDLVKWLKEGVDNRDGDLYKVTTVGSYATVQTVPAPYAVYSNLAPTGDAAAGVSFYTAKCTVCHNVDGNGTTDATGPVMPAGVKNQTTGAGSANPAVSSTKIYGLGSYFRYNTASGVFTVITGKFGNVPWMAATPVTQEEMRNLLAAFRDTNRFPDFATARPNP